MYVQLQMVNLAEVAVANSNRWLNASPQVEQVSQMATFAEGLLEYHQQCTEILKGLVEVLQIKWGLLSSSRGSRKHPDRNH